MRQNTIPDDLQPKPSDRIVCVKVGKIKRENFYEMARKYWKVSMRRALNATHVLAIEDGIVKAVYRPHKWYPTKNTRYFGRCEFEGEEDTQSEYIGKSVGHLYGQSQNPIRYINL